jgi:hypothetical protein
MRVKEYVSGWAQPRCFCFAALASGHGQTAEADLHNFLTEWLEPAATSKFQMQPFLSHRIAALLGPKRKRM